MFIFFLLRHSSLVPEIKIFSLFYLYYIPHVFVSPNTTITVVCVSCSSISFMCKHARPFWCRSRFSDRSLSQGKGNRSFPVNSLSSFYLILYFLAIISLPTMSITNVYTVIGDSNIKRNMTSMNIASRTVMKDCQVIDCPSLDTLEAALASVRDESTVLIFSAISELLASGSDRGTVQASMNFVLSSVATKLSILCRARPSLQVLLLSCRLSLSLA